MAWIRLVLAGALDVCLCTAMYGTRPTRTGADRPHSINLSTVKPNFVAMWVAGHPVMAVELNQALQTLPPPQRAGFTLHPQLAMQWYGRLVALSQEARREHLDHGLDLVHGTVVDHRNALVAVLVRRIARDAEPTPAQIRAYYQQHAGEFMQARGRLLRISDRTVLASRSQRTPQQALEKIQALARQLRGGADFAALARQNSDDPATRAQGGAFGYITRQTQIPEIDRLLWTLPPGQTSAPVRTRFGYELVCVEDRRLMPLAQAQPLIAGKLRLEAITARTRQIIAAAHIRMNPQLAAPNPSPANR